jgi:hypothetical protein
MPLRLEVGNLYRTRCGYAVRIVFDNANGGDVHGRPLKAVGLMTNNDLSGEESVGLWTLNGIEEGSDDFDDNPFDIVELIRSAGVH